MKTLLATIIIIICTYLPAQADTRYEHTPRMIQPHCSVYQHYYRVPYYVNYMYYPTYEYRYYYGLYPYDYQYYSLDWGCNLW